MMDYSTLTKDELLAAKARNQDDMNAIRSQLELVKINRQTKHVYADPHWLGRARRALRAKGTEAERIAAELGKRRREDSKTRNSDFNEHLVAVLKERLNPANFGILVAEANRRMEMETEL